MADNNIDGLSIEVTATARDAATSISALIEPLKQLVSVLSPAEKSLASFATILSKSSKAAPSVATAQSRVQDAMNKSGAAAVKNASKINAYVSAQSALSGAKITAMNVPLSQAANAPLVSSIPKVQTTTVPKTTTTPTVAASNMSSTVSGFSRVQSAAAKVQSTLSTMQTKLKQLSTSGSNAVNTLGGSFIQLRSSIFFALFALTTIGAAIKTTIGNAVDYVETLNLFNVAMRNNTTAANDFVTAMSNAFGLDPARIMKYQSTFFQVAESMGVANTQAYTLSEALTRLTFDVASLRNMSFDETFTKMQAILTGQDRAIRSLGGSIQQTTLAEVAHSIGLKANVSDMTQAQKSLLRLIAYYRQSAVAQGDMGRTLLQPANLLRILGDQVSITARAIGSLFIPVIQAVLPYIIYFVRAVGMAVSSLATFFGIDIKKFSGSVPDVSFSDTLDKNMGSTADNAKKAASSVKKMKDYTLGIDELNIVSPQDTTSAGGAGGVGGGGGGTGIADAGIMNDLIQAIQDQLDKSLGAPFLDLMDSIDKKVKAAKKAIEPFLTALGNLWDAMKPFMANVWTGFTAFFTGTLIPLSLWALNNVIAPAINLIANALKAINTYAPWAAQSLGWVLGAFVAMKGLNSVVGILMKFSGVFRGMLGLKNIETMVSGLLGTFQTFALVVSGLFNNSIPSALGTGGRIFMSIILQMKTAIVGLAATAGVSLGWIAAAVAALVVIGIIVYKNWDKIKLAILPTLIVMRAALKPLWNDFKGLGNTLKSAMLPIGKSLKELWNDLVGLFKTFSPVIRVIGALLGVWLKGEFIKIITVIKIAVGVIRMIITGFTILIVIVLKVIDVFVKLADNAVTSLKLINQALSGDFKGATSSFNHLRDNVKGMGQDFKDMGTTYIGGVNKNMKTVASTATGLSTTFSKTKTATQNVTQASKNNAYATKDVTTKTLSYADSLKAWNGTSKETARGVDGLYHSVDSYSVLMRNTTEADIKNKQAKLDLKAAQKEYNDAVGKYGAKSDEARSAQLRLRDATLSAKDAAQDYNKAVSASKTLTELEKMRKAWERLMNQIYSTKGAHKTKSGVYVNVGGHKINAGMNASGGVNASGSMFIAGEAGPELVGSFGGNSNTVMPLENSGFVEAMSKAVYSAVASAMQMGSGSSASGDVYLDIDKVGTVMSKHDRRKGTNSSLVTVN